jgi:hypothetical protein
MKQKRKGLLLDGKERCIPESTTFNLNPTAIISND